MPILVKDTNSTPFGKYSAGRNTVLLRIINKTGFSRGVVRKWIGNQWREKGYTIVDVCIRGINYRLDITNNTTDEKILTSSKYYDREEINALSAPLNTIPEKAKSGTAFIDVGANTGYYSLNLAKRGYSIIIAIEPNPPTLKLLRFNIEINNFNDVITVVPLCIGSGEKTPFYCSEGLGSASAFSDNGNSEHIMVDSSPLLRIIEANRISKIGGMKIDIEGYEDRALFPFFQTAPASLWPQVMVIEDCHRELWQCDIVKELTKIGYGITRKTRSNCILTIKTIS